MWIGCATDKGIDLIPFHILLQVLQRCKMSKYYVYHLIDPRDNSVFYVGKGTKNRIDQHERDARNLKFANAAKESVIHAIWNAGLQVIKVKVAHFTSEQDAYKFEKEQIDEIGIINLTNLAKGGESDDFKALKQAETFIDIQTHNLAFYTGKRHSDAIWLINGMKDCVRDIKASIERKRIAST
jgi:hypothetical protein